MLFLTLGTLLVLGVAAGFLAAQPAQPRVLFNDMIANDPYATFWKWLFLSAAGLTVLIAARSTQFGRDQIGVFYPLRSPSCSAWSVGRTGAIFRDA